MVGSFAWFARMSELVCNNLYFTLVYIKFGFNCSCVWVDDMIGGFDSIWVMVIVSYGVMSVNFVDGVVLVSGHLLLTVVKCCFSPCFFSVIFRVIFYLVDASESNGLGILWFT